MKPQRITYRHLPTTKANAKTQGWQRVCLSNLTTKSTDNPAAEEEHRTANTGLAKVAVQFSEILKFAKFTNLETVITNFRITIIRN
jgi:hypothetical protein